MGRDKERMIVDEERARQRAKDNGDVCGVCSEPLVTEEQVFEGICPRCDHLMNKND